MESRHDSENAERILINLRPRELVGADSPLKMFFEVIIIMLECNLCVRLCV